MGGRSVSVIAWIEIVERTVFWLRPLARIVIALPARVTKKWTRTSSVLINSPMRSFTN